MKCPKKEMFAPESCPKCGKTTEVEHYNTGWRCICKCGWYGVFHFDKRCLDCEELHSRIVQGKASILPSKCYPAGGLPCSFIGKLGAIPEIKHDDPYEVHRQIRG